MSHNTRLKHLGFDIFDEFVLDVPVEADVTLLRVHTVQYSLQFLEVVVPADWSLQQHYIIVKGKKVRLLVLVFTNTLNAVQPSRQIVANDISGRRYHPRKEVSYGRGCSTHRNSPGTRCSFSSGPES